MTRSKKESIANPVAEARRYVQNAKELLDGKARLDTETQAYQDRKYIRMAGNTLWNGVLLILNATFQLENKKGRLSIYDYRNVVGQRDKKLLDMVNRGYDTMHLAMGYDGNQSKVTCLDGLKLANDIIDRCEVMLTKAA